MQNPVILDIKCNSLDDGQGIRTVVFFKGCPLSCVWCHNPESKSQEAELYYSKEDCIKCGSCIALCKHGAIDFSNKYFIDREKCTKCFECVSVCPSKALKVAGKEWNLDNLMQKILSDKVFYDVSNGGVTLSGGEATLYPEFAGELLKRCKENNINTLVETCGCFNYAKFEKYMLPYIDTIYFDLKIFDTDLHKKYCGQDNKNILNNFKKLVTVSNNSNLTLLARTPLIPGISDTKENLNATADFLVSLGVKESQLLPYNPTWYPKNFSIGKETDPKIKDCTQWQSKEKIQECKDIYLDKKIKI